MYKISDFQWIYLIKLECRRSLKSLQTFIIVGDDVAVLMYLVQLVKYQSLSQPWAFSFSATPVNENKL